jgi:hypothetical protein
MAKPPGFSSEKKWLPRMILILAFPRTIIQIPYHDYWKPSNMILDNHQITIK